MLSQFWKFQSSTLSGSKAIFSFLSWSWRCKEHPCPLSPDLGLWLGLEVPDLGLASWSWFHYGHCQCGSVWLSVGQCGSVWVSVGGCIWSNMAWCGSVLISVGGCIWSNTAWCELVWLSVGQGGIFFRNNLGNPYENFV